MASIFGSDRVRLSSAISVLPARCPDYPGFRDVFLASIFSSDRVPLSFASSVLPARRSGCHGSRNSCGLTSIFHPTTALPDLWVALTAGVRAVMAPTPCFTWRVHIFGSGRDPSQIRRFHATEGDPDCCEFCGASHPRRVPPPITASRLLDRPVRRVGRCPVDSLHSLCRQTDFVRYRVAPWVSGE